MKKKEKIKKSLEGYQNLSVEEKNKKQEYGRKIEKCFTKCEKKKNCFLKLSFIQINAKVIFLKKM